MLSEACKVNITKCCEFSDEVAQQVGLCVCVCEFKYVMGMKMRQKQMWLGRAKPVSSKLNINS